MSSSDRKQPSSLKKWGKFLLRWTVAVVGIGWVVLNTPAYDKVTIVDEQTMRPVKVKLARELKEADPAARIVDPDTEQVRDVPRAVLVNAPDKRTVTVRDDAGGEQKRHLLAIDLTDDLRVPQRFLVETEDAAGLPRRMWRWITGSGPKGQWVLLDRVVNYELGVPYPLVDQGIVPMIAKADRRFLWGAVFIFPVTFLLTGFRWHLLLSAVDIRIGAAKAFIINMVGAFYNTFLPGSTGGDVVKAVYAARLAPDQRTRAVMTVLIDRAIGLLGLIMLGGAMSAYLATVPEQVGEAVARRCAQVAVGAIAILSATVIGLSVVYSPLLRRFTGMDFAMARLPAKVRDRAEKALHTMELYRQRPRVVLLALLITFPVHITVIFSAMCAGMAFGLPLTPGYYWVVVPVVVLAGAIPISPQGAGVMEFFAILLTRKQGCTVSQAFALTMSIRLVQILWNLMGGIFVIRGGYHAPTQKETDEVEDSTDDIPPDGHAREEHTPDVHTRHDAARGTHSEAAPVADLRPRSTG